MKRGRLDALLQNPGSARGVADLMPASAADDRNGERVGGTRRRPELTSPVSPGTDPQGVEHGVNPRHGRSQVLHRPVA